jgi:hypothetical protein
MSALERPFNNEWILPVPQTAEFLQMLHRIRFEPHTDLSTGISLKSKDRACDPDQL